MSTKKILAALFFLSISFSCFSQDIESNRQIMKKVMSDSENYMFATAVADSFDLAIKNAVGMLASQIETNVKSVSTNTTTLTDNSEGFSETSYFSSIVETFTDMRLSCYHILMTGKPTKKNKNYEAFVYISSEKVEELLEEMRQAEEQAALERFNRLVADVRFYYEEGLKSLNDTRIGDALKYFFWSYAMSAGTQVTVIRDEIPQHAESVLSTLIDNTLDAINIVCEAEEEEKVNEFQTSYIKRLGFYYKHGNTYKKITCLDYDYHNGNTFVSGPRVRDGVSVAELSYDLDQIKIHCIYRYAENETPPQIYEILKNKNLGLFSASDKTLKLDVIRKALPVEQVGKQEVELAENSQETLKDADITIDSARVDLLYDIMEEIEHSIRTKQYEAVNSYFTENGLDCFYKLIKYGNATIVGEPVYEFLPFGQIVICRSITMQFRFRNNKKFVENVTFRFNNDNLVESIAFELTDVAQHDIIDNEDWKMNSRLTLLTFMEDYQTAYALKRLDYLEKIFSENALIISGYKVFTKTQSDGIKLNGYTHYDTLTKSQYIERLRKFFNNKEYINLNFSDTEFTQAWYTEDFFGVRVRQEYFSNTYGDVGYLFLLVDLRGKEPVIHVRAWQDDKLPLDHLFSLKDVY